MLHKERPDLQARISSEGWARQLLDKRKANGHWGDDFYQPKWISTHYTLLDLRHLHVAPDYPTIKQTIAMTLDTCLADDGGIKLGPSTSVHSDICVNGMFLNYASYFQTEEERLHSVVDSLLAERMGDGGFNCCSNRSGARHSSLHSTLSVLEGMSSYARAGHTYRLEELMAARQSAEAFILLHQLFLSDRTGDIIQKEFLKLTFPGRWKYNILRALDYFRQANMAWDDRMKPAIEVLRKKQRKDGRWNMQAAHAGQVHFVMEEAGKASRWNTLRAMRTLEHFHQ